MTPPLLLFVFALEPAALDAMRAAFPDRAVEIEIVALGGAGFEPGASAESGTLQFPLAGLARPPLNRPDAPVTWRGSRRLKSNATLPVWATVTIRESATWVEALDTLPLNQVIRESQLASRSGYRFPAASETVAALDGVVGRRARRTIRAGEVVTRAMLKVAPAVTRGQTVGVEVLSGAVVLRFEARADTDAAIDDLLLVSAGQRRFKTRVKEPGKVTIDAKTSLLTHSRSAGGGSGAEQVRQ